MHGGYGQPQTAMSFDPALGGVGSPGAGQQFDYQSAIDPALEAAAPAASAPAVYQTTTPGKPSHDRPQLYPQNPFCCIDTRVGGGPTNSHPSITP